MTPEDLFEIICAYISRKGCGTRLVGDSMPAAREAFSRCLIGDSFPSLWFEFPLMGRPRFDLHIILSRETLAQCDTLPPVLAHGSFGRALDWFRTHGHSPGVAFACDISIGRTDSHGIHILDSKGEDSAGLFSAMGGPDAVNLLRDHVKRVPSEWRMWYYGLLPGRAGRPVRADFYVDEDLKQKYVHSPELFASHLKEAGFTTVSETMLAWMKEIAASPFQMELQFDILGDGSLGPTMGISAGMESKKRLTGEQEHAAIAIFNRLEEQGLSDDRWRFIPDTFFAKRVKFQNEDFEIYHAPVFIKMRFRDGQALDAKVYSQAMAKDMATNGPKNA